MSIMRNPLNNIYDDKITFENVTKTWKIVRKTCKNRKAVFKYSINKNINNYTIYRIDATKVRLFIRLILSIFTYTKISAHQTKQADIYKLGMLSCSLHAK